MTITNNAGGVISSTGGVVVRLEGTDTLINSGTIKREDITTGNALRIDGSNNTVTLKEGSILVGNITVITGNTGNTLQIDQGFGQTYFYSVTDTDGNLTLEDLSGNVVVAGSAGSVGLGAQESVDELLGLRAFNLRSALKRYAAAPAIFKEDKLWAEPFSYFLQTRRQQFHTRLRGLWLWH